MLKGLNSSDIVLSYTLKYFTEKAFVPNPKWSLTIPSSLSSICGAVHQTYNNEEQHLKKKHNKL